MLALVAAAASAGFWRTPIASGQDAAPATPTPTGVVMPTRSPRNANYTISARLDPATRTLTGTEVITWRNITANPTQELRFHTYWNAWRDGRSTFLRERALVGGAGHADEDFATLQITALQVEQRRAAGAVDGVARADLAARATFIAPDDGNADDATVMRVPLDAPVQPGDSVRVELSWTARVPKPFARTGVVGRFYFLAQWFPKLGVLEDGGWNCHQFHANTEFFSDFGVYDVKLTVPTGWTVGATGALREATDHGDGTTTHAYYQEDVHDFAWTTSPTLVERLADFAPAGGTSGTPGTTGRPGTPGTPATAQRPLRLRLLLQPEHLSQAEAHLAAARTALTYFARWAGPYPYDQLTIVDPAFQSEADGMEYPTLITAGTLWLNGSAVTIATPHEVVIHEIGHQFFYGIVASNEFEDAWMDEGINTYLTARALVQDFPHTYYERRFFGGFVPWVFPDLAVSRETYWNRLAGYRRAPKTDVPSEPSYRYSVSGGRVVTYNKTALWLNTLERQLGWPVMERVFQTYFDRWQFGHPRPADFFAVVNEVSGQRLDDFVDQVYRTSNVFDYGVDTLTSARDGAGYRTDLVVRRYGEAVAPVAVVVTLESGDRIAERWDGRDRWKHYVFHRPSRAASAAVDPERTLLLDVNVTNNSKTLANPRGRAAAVKWSSKWLLWLEDALLTWAFFA